MYDETGSETGKFRAGLVSHMPELRSFARRLTANAAGADDLVQETMVKALANEDRFRLGTNLRAWLFRILRNTFISDMRALKSATDYLRELPPERLFASPNQEAAMTLADVRALIEALPQAQRLAVQLICVFGWTYEEAAKACDCEVGTIKSRLSRARGKLTEQVE